MRHVVVVTFKMTPDEETGGISPNTVERVERAVMDMGGYDLLIDIEEDKEPLYKGGGPKTKK